MPAEPNLQPMFGLLWDNKQNPYCPADATLLSHYTWMPADYDILQCLQCGRRVGIRHDEVGNITLSRAKNLIRGK